MTRNIAASVRDRLYKLSSGRGEDFQAILERYALERLLYRLGSSPYRRQFVLKGAMLFALWDRDSYRYRATRDVDLLGVGEPRPEKLVEIFQELCHATGSNDDGVVFLPESVRAGPIRAADEYSGIRVQLTARLEQARIGLQADIGFGDIVIPAPSEADYPTLLDGPAPHLRVYSRESVVAEKFHAMVHLGETNSRFKDFYDIWSMARRFDFDGGILCAALKATFGRRQTPLPTGLPAALTPRFYADREVRWASLFKRGSFGDQRLPFVEVGESLRAFLWPPAQAVALTEELSHRWPPGGPWLSEL